MYKIGYACKYMSEDQSLSKKILEETQRPFNTKTTTLSWLSRQTEIESVTRLNEIVIHNIESIYKQLTNITKHRNKHLYMMRISSDILPFYTHKRWNYIYTHNSLSRYIEKRFGEIGDYARKHNIRLSFHPGQFCVLGSDKVDVVDRSIKEFEYHVDMLRMMGYGQTFQDAKCNVHIGGKLGPEGFRVSYYGLSKEAKRVITVENDEMSHGLDEVLTLADLIPITMDIHHHWVRTGEYIDVHDERVSLVKRSWRGRRPTMHYSLSREDLLIGHDINTKPDMDTLLAQGYKKQKLRAHSDMMWNSACNDWAASFLSSFDIMIEAKNKNLAQQAFYEDIKDKLAESQHSCG